MCLLAGSQRKNNLLQREERYLIPAPNCIWKEQGDCQHCTEFGGFDKLKVTLFFYHQLFISVLCPGIL